MPSPRRAIRSSPCGRRSRQSFRPRLPETLEESPSGLGQPKAEAAEPTPLVALWSQSRELDVAIRFAVLHLSPVGDRLIRFRERTVVATVELRRRVEFVSTRVDLFDVVVGDPGNGHRNHRPLIGITLGHEAPLAKAARPLGLNGP